MSDRDDAKTTGDETVTGKTEPRRKPRYTLEQLLEGLTPDMCHGEVCFGPPVGREFPNEEK